jgi:outer membrane lipoprotein-sorting protein
MEDHNDFNHDDLLDRAVEAVLRSPAPVELPPDQVADLVAQVRRAVEKPIPITLFERIKNMKPITRIAVTATVLIVIAGLISWLAPNGSTAVAFAGVVEALNSVETATWKTENTAEGPDKKIVKWTTTNMFLAPAHERSEITADGEKSQSVSITDGEKDNMVILTPATKTAMVLKFQNLPKENPFGKTFQGLRELVAEAQSGKDGKVERLGEKTVDGHKAVGFHMQHGAIDLKLWADPKTLLPIRIEESVTNPASMIVMTDFQTGMKLDKSLFSVDVPAGYTVQQTQQFDISQFDPAKTKPLQFVADVLKMAAEYNDGVFPPELRGEQGIDGFIQRGAMAAAKKNPSEAMKIAMDLSAKLGAAFGVLYALPPESMHYAGKDAKLGTPDKPILWLKRKSGAYDVLYADQSIKEVPAKDAPKALTEGSEKK